ncbi:hypothetical protein OOT46_30065 [Aquabacterium sp. A7-Y]|uniref:hypothetical protein n=1 Tax=Aquabacterium sp. A7-Y TaxID=1349605 RepID=UPI00223E60BC|nr:hypothetical protein [Aquabacterium sp. A7-Y]MCW7542045.1 hypothetical protein [Aquabacterium sp. A7-Y]
MGEAKRRGLQLRQLEADLRARVAAGEFGAAGQAQNYLVVIDKSARGRDLLQALRTMPEFQGLKPLFEAEPFRLWETSALFQYVLLSSGDASAEQRTTVAATTERLVAEVLPRVMRRLQSAGAAWGLVAGLADEAARAVEACRPAAA